MQAASVSRDYCLPSTLASSGLQNGNYVLFGPYSAFCFSSGCWRPSRLTTLRCYDARFIESKAAHDFDKFLLDVDNLFHRLLPHVRCIRLARGTYQADYYSSKGLQWSTKF